jgi:hypothetical protein
VSKRWSHREIGISEGERTGTSKVSKFRRNRDRPLEDTRGRDRSHRGRPDKEVVYRRLGHREIGDPGDKRFEVVCRIIHSWCHFCQRFESESGFIIRTNRQLKTRNAIPRSVEDSWQHIRGSGSPLSGNQLSAPRVRRSGAVDLCDCSLPLILVTEEGLLGDVKSGVCASGNRGFR